VEEFEKYDALLGSSNILRCYGLLVEKDQENENSERISLVLEYARHGNLFDYLQHHSVSWEKKIKMCQQIAEGLEYCHKKNIIHLDVKPENVLVDDDEIPKLAVSIEAKRKHLILKVLR